jgi:hypothetical protein
VSKHFAANADKFPRYQPGVTPVCAPSVAKRDERWKASPCHSLFHVKHTLAEKYAAMNVEVTTDAATTTATLSRRPSAMNLNSYTSMSAL